MAEPFNIDTKLAEESAAWLMRLAEDDSPACRSAFYAWFKQSPRHVEEFLQATEMTRALSNVDPEQRIDVSAFLASASNVVALDGGSGLAAANQAAAVSAIDRRPPAYRRSIIAGSIAAALAVTVAGMLYSMQPSGHAFSTAIGEQRTVKLQDGSIVTLNTRSNLQVSFDKSVREVRLIEGQALFLVAHEPARPFRVITDTATVQAIGTQFDVHRSSQGTTVAVIEGSVQVLPVSNITATSPAPYLSAGEEARVGVEGKLTTRSLPNPATVVAWRERRLEFHDVALADVAAEFNRYNALQIRVERTVDPDKRITGIFDADSPQALIGFLQKDRSLQLERRDGALVILPRS